MNNNFTYIDGNNLYRGVNNSGWSYENLCDQGVIVTSDGDYSGLVKFLQSKNKLRIILSPSIQEKCSILLKRTNAPITYLNDIKDKISLNRKSPH